MLATTGARTASAVALQQAHAFLDLAERLIAVTSPWLIAIGGLSGTGKSALARALGASFGPAPGARILRSDVLRKRVAGVSPEQRLSSAFYTPLANRTVYELVNDLTARHLSNGTSVVADAVFPGSDERATIARGAAHAHVPFFGLWLDAPEAIRLERVGQRTADASDADAGVVRAQSHHSAGLLGEWHQLRADQPLAAVATDARANITGAGACGSSHGLRGSSLDNTAAAVRVSKEDDKSG